MRLLLNRAVADTEVYLIDGTNHRYLFVIHVGYRSQEVGYYARSYSF